MQFQHGDILAFYGGDFGSRAISAITCWPVGPRELWFPPSHVGIISGHAWNAIESTGLQGQIYLPRQSLLESTTACPHPCLRQRKIVSGWQVQVPERRVQDYVLGGGWVDVYRLNYPTEQHYQALNIASEGLRYADYDYLGAGLSGTKLWQLLGLLFPRPNLDALFCSEFLAALLMRAGLMNWDNPTRYNPGRLMRTLVWTGVYTRVATIPPLTAESAAEFVPTLAAA